MKKAKAKRTAPVDENELTALELMEKLFIIFVLAHTQTLEEAAPYLNMEESTLKGRREKYGIPTPVRYSYKGPRLTHKEMVNAFMVHLAATAQVAAFMYATGAADFERLVYTADRFTRECSTFRLEHGVEGRNRGTPNGVSETKIGTGFQFFRAFPLWKLPFFR